MVILKNQEDNLDEVIFRPIFFLTFIHLLTG